MSNDTNQSIDIFVHDREAQQTTRVSLASNATQANGDSYQPAISADGRFVAFTSDATNLVSGDTNNERDVFVHDRQTGTTSRVSVSSNGTQASGYFSPGPGVGLSNTPAISADGRYVVFSSFASNLVRNDTNGTLDIFVHDRQTSQTTRVSISSDGIQANSHSSSSSSAISADGRYVVFDSNATNLVSDDTNGKGDIFVHDRQTGQTIRVSGGLNGVQANDGSGSAAISADGSSVTFSSWATNLVSGDTNSKADIFVYDRQTNQTSRVSVGSDGTESNGWAFSSTMSGDGRYVVFETLASNVLSGDTDNSPDIFVHDRTTGQTKHIARSSDKLWPGDGPIGLPTISNDGSLVAFTSFESNLVSDDTNVTADVFVHEVDWGTSPPTLNDLRVSPTSNLGEISLNWTAPGDSDGNSVVQYDIRYLDSPISEGNWTSATQISGEPTPGAPGSSETMTFGTLTTNTRWYFAIKSVDTNGDTSALSNILSIQDAGFRSNPDGYGFENYEGNFPFGDYDYRYDSLVQMFGQDNVCWMAGSVCFVKPSADLWHYRANRSMNGGHCYGMAATSSRFFDGTDRPSDFQSGASNTYDLTLANSRRNIAYYFVLQLTNPVGTQIQQIRQASPATIVNDLYTMSDPLILFVYRQDMRSGHAITPYAIEDQGNGTVHIYVYDNNHPNDNNRFVVVDTQANTWSYALSGSMTWTGSASTNSLGYVPISLHTQQPDCPWCGSSNQATNATSVISAEVWTTGGRLLITNQVGQRLGYDGSIFVDGIEDAHAMPMLLGLDEAEPTYFLPLNDTYTITLDGQTLTSTETVSVMQFGPSYATVVSDINLRPTSSDEITVASDGSLLTYNASESKEATVTLALDGADQSYSFAVIGSDIAANKTVGYWANMSEGLLVVDQSMAENSTYSVNISRVGTSGETTFLHKNILVNGGATHYFDFGAWDGQGDIELCTDIGSNGTIDQCAPLSNQFTWTIFLPAILR
ncbi:TolB family protein [Candidatus Chloroploca asiatica]|nr:PD40 domain-containing protein [Candidatus Chloroploca asiatica]